MKINHQISKVKVRKNTDQLLHMPGFFCAYLTKSNNVSLFNLFHRFYSLLVISVSFSFLFCLFRAYHVLSKRVLAVKVRIQDSHSSYFIISHFHGTTLVCVGFNKACNFGLNIWLQVIPLDITVELQKQIMSELEILYKVSASSFFLHLVYSWCTNTFTFELQKVQRLRCLFFKSLSGLFKSGICKNRHIHSLQFLLRKTRKFANSIFGTYLKNVR